METKDLANTFEMQVEFIMDTKTNKVGDRVSMTNKAATKFMAAGYVKPVSNVEATPKVTKATKATKETKED